MVTLEPISGVRYSGTIYIKKGFSSLTGDLYNEDIIKEIDFYNFSRARLKVRIDSLHRDYGEGNFISIIFD